MQPYFCSCLSIYAGVRTAAHKLSTLMVLEGDHNPRILTIVSLDLHHHHMAFVPFAYSNFKLPKGGRVVPRFSKEELT